MVPQLDVTEERIGKLQDDLSNWLASQAKGKDCNVSWHQDDNQSTLYVQRGAHRRTMPYWKDGKIEIASLRLASEDLLVYNPKQASLTIKAGLVKDNEFYLSIFAYHVAGDGSLARKALDTPMFSLEPLERGTFDYTGNGIITGIDLTWAKIRLYDIHSSVIEIKSKSVLGTLEHGLHRSPLRQGKLVSVRFRFQIHPDEGRPATVSFEVQPPVRTNLTQKRYADIIEDYLREQGVMLR
jgi:hypothetical protein